MASSNFLDEVLNTEADESVVSALVGTLESQLASSATSQAPSALCTTLLYNSNPSDVGNVLTTVSSCTSSSLNSATLAGNAPPVTVLTSTASTHQPIANGSATEVTQLNGNAVQPQGIVVQHGLGVKSGLQPVTTMASNGTTVVRQQVPQQTGVQVVSVNPAVRGTTVQQQANLVPGVAATSAVRQLAPRVILGPQQVIANRPGQVGISLQTLQGLQAAGAQGHLLVKTENGQFQLLRVGPGPVAGTAVAAPAQTSVPMTVTSTGPTPHPAMGPPTFRIQSPVISTGQQPQTSIVNVQQTSAAASVTTVVSTAPAGTAGQMTPDTAKAKCKNFLSTLLRLANEQPETVATNVRTLIQGLVDSKVEPEEFTTKLQQELNSSPQPCLIPFLKKSLPFLRHSLATKEMTIDGIRPPPLSSVNLSQPSVLTSSPSVIRPATVISSAPTQAALPRTPAIATIVRTPTAPVLGTPPAVGTPRPMRPVTPAPVKQSPKPAAKTPLPKPKAEEAKMGIQPSTSAALKGIAAARDKKVSSSSLGALAGDDDINDVAAMGGVNLAEESQKILGSTDTIGTQIRSCKDEIFLFTGPLQRRIAEIASRHGVTDVPAEVVSLVSHATQERLKTMLEKLAVIAEHRMEVVKTDPRYTVQQDVKGQLKFLEELDKLEQRKDSEKQRELLMKAAKSRSKAEDPEQAKLKAKAKEMQKAELEELRQREANMTALQAIGQRKKPRLDVTGTPTAGTFNQVPLRPRVKRVNMRDMLFLMEEERDSARSLLLYKTYLK